MKYVPAAMRVQTVLSEMRHEGHPLAIGVTSYDGNVYYGITADRDLLPDAELLGPCLQEALDELVDSATGGRPRARRGRKQRKPTEPSS